MREKIIELEEELRLAMLSNDVKKLNELISDSLVFTIPSGDVVTKKMDLDGHKSGIQKMSELNPSEQKIEIYDNLAVVTVNMQIVGTYGEDSINGNYRYTRVWAKINNRLQIVAGSVVLLSS